MAEGTEYFRHIYRKFGIYGNQPRTDRTSSYCVFLMSALKPTLFSISFACLRLIFKGGQRFRSEVLHIQDSYPCVLPF